MSQPLEPEVIPAPSLEERVAALEGRTAALARNQGRMIDQIKAVSKTVNGHTDAIKRLGADLANQLKERFRSPFGGIGL